MHQIISKYIAAVAKANGVADTSVHFAVDPQISRKMRAKMRLSSAFLTRINVAEKENNAGEVVGIKVGLTASRSGKGGYQGNDGRRQPKSVHSASSREYRCRKINFDTYWGYEELDAWAAEPEYISIINGELVKSKAESLLAIAFNGTKWADVSDPEANPKLEDCGKGWLTQQREQNPARTLGWASGKIGE